ncbi:MAG: hypothetical protein SFV21_20165 [Rhodospirillaceae bacterium]|nr:hypothetical protein [Rhodospirillaceae bacterium]
MVLSRRLRAWVSRVLAAVVLTAGVAGTLAPAHSHAAMVGHVQAVSVVAAEPSAAPCHAPPVADVLVPADLSPEKCQTLCDSATLADTGMTSAPGKAPNGALLGAADALAVAGSVRAVSVARFHPPDRSGRQAGPDRLLVTRRLLI